MTCFLQEYVGDRGKDQDKDWIVTEKDRFDRELDKNGDGSLGRAEMIEWLIPSQDSIAEDEVKHLFAAADDDDDDILRYCWYFHILVLVQLILRSM